MGVPKFFRYMSERYPCLSELVKEYQIPEFDNLYLDMNGIIHMCSHPDDFNPHFRITEEKIFSDVFHYIEVLFRMIKPQKLFFMAVDGVAPRAKMNQQRGRRFRSAKDAEILENKARERGEDLPTEPRFDSNCITPGTVFMDRLHEQLKYFVANKISTDRLWQKCKIILSGHETPGEGEHKIMDYIRYMKAQPGYNPNTRHCLYGLDADLIMLGLCTHEPHFSLLREEVRFGKKAKRRTIPEHITFYLLHLSLMREYLELEFMPLKESLPFEYDMEKIIDDWVLMGFLVGNDFIPNLPNLHIANGALPILYNAYMKILPTLNGYINEAGTLNLERFEKFMQALASIDMDNFSEQYADLKYFQSKTGRRPNDKERTSYRSKNLIPWNMEDDGVHEKKTMNPELEALIKSTDELLMEPKESGWEVEIKTVGEIMETSTIDSSDVTEITKEFIGELVEKALGEVKKEDISKDQAEEGAEVEVTKIQMNGLDHSQKNKSVLVEPSQSNLEDLALGLIDLDESDGESYYSDPESDESDELMKAEFLQLKNDYYMNKLDYSKVTPEVMRSQAEGYVRAIQWNLNYYYNGCCSWSWYYPHHYAPYISDVKEFSSLKLEYEMGTPFLPFEQLLAVLPGASKTLLPVPYQDLMVSDDSPIKQYYPTDFKTDLNGKKQEWEAVVLIPFIAENLLLESMMPLKDQLTEDEVRRNTHGPMLVYEYTTENQGKFEAPEYFPPVENCYAKITPVTIEDIRVPKDKLIKGPCLGAITDTYYPGFPTFKHLKYRGQLEKAKVKVFDQPSQNDNMIITILSEQSESKLQAVAQQLIGKTVFVNWPHLSEALVVAVSDNTGKLFAASNPGEFSKEVFKSNQSSVWQTMRNASASRFWERLGIDVGKVTILVHVRNICGSKYVYSQTGAISIEKQWNIAETFHPLQTVVSELNVSVSDQVTYHNIQNLFPVGSIVFMLGHPHYGAMGEVIDNTTLKSGRIKVNMCGVSEPEFSVLYKMQQESKYMPASIASQRLAITPHLLSRITGSIFVCPSHLLNDTKSQNRVNIGLNLKLNKKNEEIPGYTKKVDGQWLYSTRAVDLVMDYMNNFPNVFTYIQTHVGSDVLNDKDLFPLGDSKAQLKELQDWLKKQPHTDIEHQAVGSQVAEPEVVRKIEEIVDDFNNKHKVVKQIIMQVKPHLLYKPEVQSGYLPPDVTTVFRLYDRVVNVRESYTVPYGCKGTVIGIQTTNKLDPAASNDMEVMYDIVFDQPFAGGLQLNCSPNRGYRVPKPALINITHGMRVVQQKTLNPATNNPWYGPKVPQSGLLPTPPHQPQMMSQNSAFVNWNPSNQGYSQQRQQSVFCPPFIQRQNSAPGGHYQQQPPLRPPGVQPPQRQPSQSVGSEFQAFYQDLQRNQPPPPNIFAPPPALPRNLPNHMPQFNQAQNYSTQSSFDAPRTVEQHARSQEKKVAPVPQQQKQSTPYYCVQLFNYCQTFGKGVPKYNYFTVGDKFRAQIFLFDGKTVIGDEMPTKAESSEDAAKKMMTMIVNGNTQSSNGASAAPVWEKVVPNYVNPSGFPNPPKQWCQKDGTKTQPQEKRSPNVQKAKKNAPHNTSHKKEEQTTQPNSTFVPLQAVKQQRNKSSTNVQDADGANQSAGKSSQMASHHGSPGKNQAASTGNKQENTVSDDTPAKPKQRKSRIAANFSGVSGNK